MGIDGLALMKREGLLKSLYAYLWQRASWRSHPFRPSFWPLQQIDILGRASPDTMSPSYNDQGDSDRIEYHSAIYICRVITATHINTC